MSLIDEIEAAKAKLDTIRTRQAPIRNELEAMMRDALVILDDELRQAEETHECLIHTRDATLSKWRIFLKSTPPWCIRTQAFREGPSIASIYLIRYQTRLFWNALIRVPRKEGVSVKRESTILGTYDPNKDHLEVLQNHQATVDQRLVSLGYLLQEDTSLQK